VGDDVEPRREFIEKNAKHVKNLDMRAHARRIPAFGARCIAVERRRTSSGHGAVGQPLA